MCVINVISYLAIVIFWLLAHWIVIFCIWVLHCILYYSCYTYKNGVWKQSRMGVVWDNGGICSHFQKREGTVLCFCPSHTFGGKRVGNSWELDLGMEVKLPFFACQFWTLPPHLSVTAKYPSHYQPHPAHTHFQVHP